MPGLIDQVPAYGRQEPAEAMYNLSGDVGQRQRARGEWERAEAARARPGAARTIPTW